MTKDLQYLVSNVYSPCGLTLGDFKLEPESQEYGACRFLLDSHKVIFRNAKITPKKVGQFVTFWKRADNGPICPFEESDDFDCFVINVSKGHLLGQFVFPKEVLVTKGIVNTPKKEGKRGFRVYPIWDVATSKQAQSTQNWQLRHFFEIHDETNYNKVQSLFGAV
ncbi:MepB family protein [Zobellia galactanivorans]|uniref:MepB family protein n=1 Tax=Zobellia galactanivorans (strain DSM 12802 / CCUG 47099 / CIP 106680 / NCIMB 13871 / Dsij) TaxID=63186 RepID=UPI001C078B75|nr:MepB family protein [Zobellia galactanivorans]MBU3024571.1 MepB family protein [Zobellia galactanivorans]MDO6810844.1 MepB family protein [Zobellia galactanivorans]